MFTSGEEIEVVPKARLDAVEAAGIELMGAGASLCDEIDDSLHPAIREWVARVAEFRAALTTTEQAVTGQDDDG